MCQPKYWNKVFSESPERNNKGETVVAILAERSDFENFRIEVVVSGVNIQIAQKIKKALDTLESYRDCDCTVKLGVCVKHLDSMSIFQTAGAKSEVIIGRR